MSAMGGDLIEPARVEDRLRRLQRVSLELAAAVVIDDVVATVIDVLDAPIAAPSRSLWLARDGSDVLELVAHRGMPDEAAARFRRIPLSADLRCGRRPGTSDRRQRGTRRRRRAVRQPPGRARSTSGFLAIPPRRPALRRRGGHRRRRRARRP
jgi:hypothetical protein